MTNSVQAAIEQRISTNKFDSTRSLSKAEVEHLVSLATRAPSAFNLQNWKFIAVQSAEAKERLKAVSYGQQKVVDAAVTFIVCGTLDEHNTLKNALQPAVKAGLIDDGMVEGWVNMAKGFYENNPQFQRDEAIRSASLAAMTLMLAAQGQGLATGPMVGFDPAGVAKEFNLSANDVPVMLLTVGYAAEGNWPQKPRLATADVLRFA